MRKTTMKRAGLAAVMAGALFLLAACSGGTAEEPGETPATGTDTSDARAAAQAIVDEFLPEQPPVEVEPLKEAPAEGLTLGILACEFPACVKTVEGAEAAATALGWSVNKYSTEISPEAYSEAWGRMMADKPDAIIFNGIMPNDIIRNYLDEAKAAGIPMVSIAASDPPDDTVRAVTSASGSLTESGRLMGAAIAADSEEAPEVLFVWDPAQVAIFGVVKESIEEQIAAVGGKVTTVDTQSSEIGKAVPGAVVSAVQANPNAQYVAFAIADFTAGVPEALATIDSDVKLVTRSPGEGNLKNILNGVEWVGVAEENVAAGWSAMDALLRIQQGMTFDANPKGWHQILTADNIDKSDPAASTLTPGVPDAYLEAWGVK